MSNITCQFVATGPKEERSSMWMRASEEQLKTGVHAIKLENRDGLWIEKPDMWNKYLRRPESLEEICLAQFAKMYRGSPEQPEDFEEENEDNEQHEEEEIGERKFHFIMTFKDNGCRGKTLPEVIKLVNPCPGERSSLKKRKYPAALRFHKSKKDDDHRRFMMNELMLYFPLRSEINLDQVETMYNEEYMGRRKVDIVKNQVMEFLESVTEARYHVEQLAKDGDLDLREIGEMVDASGVQENDECANEGAELHKDFLFCDPDEIKKVEHRATKSVFKQIDLPTSDDLRRKTESLDKFQKEVVNIAVTFAKEIVKARKSTNSHPRAPLMMVHGGAGAGKSTVINVVAMWTQKILQRSGDSPDQPFVLKTAFTGCAASNIEGMTLHGAFGFSFSHQHFSLSDKIRDQRRATLRNLKLVIIDEISMVKSDMLYMLDLRLQEIKEKVGVPFGGVAVFAFGDMMQLKPCQGSYIFKEPFNTDFKLIHSKFPRWKMFSCIVLEKNHRQGRDKTYAETLNRIRIAKHTDSDIDLLSSRVRPQNHEDLRNCSMFIGCKRRDIAAINKKYINSLPGETEVIRALHFCATQKVFKPTIDKKDGVVGSTSLQDELRLKIGVKIMIVHNIDTADLLTNGQIGTLIEVIRSGDNKIQVLVIKLNDNKVGKRNRQQNPNLAPRFPECVFVERVSIQYTLRSKSGDIGTTATVIQFPVKLAFAITAHKIQGQSILHPTTVAMDLESVFGPAQAYVMLSRVQSIDQLFIVGHLSENSLRISSEAIKEFENLEKISWNKNPSPWHKSEENSLKIATLNCAGMLSHLRDIVKDDKILQGHIVHLLETSLPLDCDVSDININGFEAHFIKAGKGKGLATFLQDDLEDYFATLLKEETMQIGVFEFDQVDVITVYR